MTYNLTEPKAGDAWRNHIKQFEALDSWFNSLSEVTQLWLSQQIDIFAGKYPISGAKKEDIQPVLRWVKASTKMPEYNAGVLVFIPDEDFHITSGMWDVSNKWVLLDEYRVPDCEVTHWMPIPEIPAEYQKDQKDNDAIMEFLSQHKDFLKTTLAENKTEREDDVVSESIEPFKESKPLGGMEMEIINKTFSRLAHKEQPSSSTVGENVEQEWHCVKDCLPDYDERVLWLLEDGNMVIEDLDKDGNPWLLDDEDDEIVELFGGTPKATHWRKLPPAPPIQEQPIKTNQ